MKPRQIPSITAAAAQRRRILLALRAGPKTTEDLRQLGCYQAPTRVYELREQGYEIETSRVSLWDRDGFQHRGVALYSLEAEPNSTETP